VTYSGEEISQSVGSNYSGWSAYEQYINTQKQQCSKLYTIHEFKGDIKPQVQQVDLWPKSAGFSQGLAKNCTQLTQHTELTGLSMDAIVIITTICYINGSKKIKRGTVKILQQYGKLKNN